MNSIKQVASLADWQIERIENGLFEQMSYPSMLDKQYESTVNFVRCVLDPWLKLHFGERCDVFEHGCECCIRWAMADRLLAYDRVGTPEKIEDEIRVLTECLNWRQNMLNEMNRLEQQRDGQTGSTDGD